MFLVIVTQRPDKLDPLVVSECENRAIMRLSSAAVLTKTQSLLGLDGDKELDRCLNFQKGRFMLAGHWAGKATRAGYCAMRRTVEGGRSLRDEHWAQAERPATEGKLSK